MFGHDNKFDKAASLSINTTVVGIVITCLAFAQNRFVSCIKIVEKLTNASANKFLYVVTKVATTPGQNVCVLGRPGREMITMPYAVVDENGIFVAAEKDGQQILEPNFPLEAVFGELSTFAGHIEDNAHSSKCECNVECTGQQIPAPNLGNGCMVTIATMGDLPIVLHIKSYNSAQSRILARPGLCFVRGHLESDELEVKKAKAANGSDILTEDGKVPVVYVLRNRLVVDSVYESRNQRRQPWGAVPSSGVPAGANTPALTPQLADLTAAYRSSNV